MRVARSARVIKYFPQMWDMFRGLFATLKVVASGLLLIAGSLVIIGILSVHILNPVNKRVESRGVYDGCDRCGRAFESTFSSVMTFVQQIIAGDSWGTVSIPIIEEEPATAVFFGMVFIFIQLMVLNLILSMVVESSMKAAAADTDRIIKEKEAVYKEHAMDFGRLCAELDTDASGQISKAEFANGFKHNPRFVELMSLLELTNDDLDMVFEMLDADCSGGISYEEFVKELYRMKMHDSHTMLVFIKHYVTEIKRMTQNMVASELSKIRRAVTGLEAEREQQLASAPGESAQVVPPPVAEKSHALIEEVMRDLKHSLAQDVSRLAQELATGALGHGWAGPAHRPGGGGVRAPAPLAPQCIPQPLFDDDVPNLSFASDRGEKFGLIPPAARSGASCPEQHRAGDAGRRDWCAQGADPTRPPGMRSMAPGPPAQYHGPGGREA
eukprot:CAMPEP_0176235468 /NCGR_PEP_ID=MMETSP0121_2-20121125/26853_1 /TAXON_ID=160619 /ORGANISM="Kryptoperidinium foliaceum, Strain CCMP 1326" /LENGTH=440 /DNA_ID=CAMNT_0017574889 /DNA_START=1 /DNA_END=1323 /DNA_ORIENTATION=+